MLESRNPRSSECQVEDDVSEGSTMWNVNRRGLMLRSIRRRYPRHVNAPVTLVDRDADTPSVVKIIYLGYRTCWILEVEDVVIAERNPMGPTVEKHPQAISKTRYSSPMTVDPLLCSPIFADGPCVLCIKILCTKILSAESYDLKSGRRCWVPEIEDVGYGRRKML